MIVSGGNSVSLHGRFDLGAGARKWVEMSLFKSYSELGSCVGLHQTTDIANQTHDRAADFS